jgi:hypothetical protein
MINLHAIILNVVALVEHDRDPHQMILTTNYDATITSTAQINSVTSLTSCIGIDLIQCHFLLVLDYSQFLALNALLLTTVIDHSGHCCNLSFAAPWSSSPCASHRRCDIIITAAHTICNGAQSRALRTVREH